VWEQPTGPAGAEWEVPHAEVDAVVRATFARYNVVGFFADPARWESYVAAWEASFHRQLKVKASGQHPIEWWMTGSMARRTVQALEQFESAVVDGDLSHDGSSALTRHVLNARRRPTRSGMQIMKDHPDSARKIDAAVAAVAAWSCRLLALSKGADRQNSYVPRRIR
jgi:hypothetical protein